ncbi:MAG: hypothetical protein ACREJC_17205 [Tepidisphaeraceae bacterium]
MRSIRSKWLALVAGVALAAAPALSVRAAAASDNFSGIWRVTVTPDHAGAQAGQQRFEELILFEQGVLSAEACAAYGFAPSQYVVADAGGSFSTSMSSETHGTIVWSGSLTGGLIRGQVVWTKPDGDVFHYSMSASRNVVAEDAPSESDG